MARRAAGAKRRGATPAIEPRIRDEIGAIAVLAFALLSTVALATDQGAVLQWWRSALFSLLGWAAWLVPLALVSSVVGLAPGGPALAASNAVDADVGVSVSLRGPSRALAANMPIATEIPTRISRKIGVNSVAIARGTTRPAPGFPRSL